MNVINHLDLTGWKNSIRTWADKLPAFMRRRWFLATAGVVLLLALVAWGVSGSTDSRIDPGLMAEVKRGPLIVSVTERGDVEADKKKVISNELRWSATIKQVVTDGTSVKEGDVIIEFECKELSDAIAKQKMEVQEAESLYIEASENLKIKKKDLANKVQKAQHALLDAQQNLLRYQKGQGPVTLRQAQSDVDLAQQELTLSQKELDFMHTVNDLPEMKDNQPYSKKDLDAKALEVKRKSASVENAQAKIGMIQEYDDQKELRKLNDAITDAELQQEQSVIEERTSLLVDDSKVQTRNSTLEMKKKELGLLLEDEAKMIVKADSEGLVIYKTSNHWRDRGSVAVTVGEKIDSHQQLMIIPDLTSLQVSTKVSESMKEQVTLGLESYVRLDAQPDAVLKATVTKVAPVPESQGWWASRNMKVYTVIVKVDEGEQALLKPEMTAKVEIVLARLADVLFVPIASVFSEQEQTYCWKVSGGSQEKVPVKVGRMSDASVEIVSGLSEGDKVLLAQPADEGAKEGGGNGKTRAEKEPKRGANGNNRG